MYLLLGLFALPVVAGSLCPLLSPYFRVQACHGGRGRKYLRKALFLEHMASSLRMNLSQSHDQSNVVCSFKS